MEKVVANNISRSPKQIVNISNDYAVLRDIMAPLITEETKVFKELESEIFGN